MNDKTYKTIRAAIDNALLRRELAEAVEEGWLSEEEANAIRRLNVPSGERRRRVRKAKARSSQGDARAAKLSDLQKRPSSWSGLR
jgi:hypothetical protein